MRECDLFLAKGQGNYETLDEQPGGFLLLTAKCAVVAAALGVGALLFQLSVAVATALIVCLLILVVLSALGVTLSF